MYEEFYGLTEKPFSLTPDPKYLYRSASHGGALEALQYAIKRREGLVVITGDIGTGKTTLCRALLEQLDPKTFAALVLNPFLAEEDLLRVVLQEFGMVSRTAIKREQLAGVSNAELVEALHRFLLSLRSLDAQAVLIIDEAQNLPLPVLEQIRILSNLETEKDKLLQIVLVGQLNLKDVLGRAELRQLHQRVSTRYELAPLPSDETPAYVQHRLSVAGGHGIIAFAPKATARLHRYTGGIPRLINLVCDRALLTACSSQTNVIEPQVVDEAAESLELVRPSRGLRGWLWARVAALAAGAVVLVQMLANRH